ncbi:ABC transporter substrate-binding protein [Aeromicrobium sp.]|uniref:ABC transporter substrate-binding protein n=1 Tax=Aeromicrobium sp. TaxID=1871063 RepID=UPI0019C87404|nr:ABC transporter substrate-binding protein [Aeromicrobium sp.]MBC7632114.1 ABC transporter substrate-binding protein [Aeromicrobium sp.]
MIDTTRVRLWRPLTGVMTAALLTLSGMLVATAPAHAANDSTKEPIKVALVADVDTFNPFTAILLASTGINRYQYEALVGYGKGSEPVAGLAATWKTSADGKTWTYNIPTDRQWSDGEPVTADDVVYTYTSIMKTSALQAANGGLVANIAGVSASDPQTVVIALKEAQASNPGQEIPIVPQHIWSKQDATTFAADKDVVGSGPFTITSYKTGQSVELKANPRFWRGKPKVAGITYVTYKNTDAAVQGLKSGEVDLVDGLTPAQYDSLKSATNITRNSGVGRRFQSLAINTGAIDINGKKLGDGNPALRDPAVRKAIFMAVDKKTLVDRVLQGLGTVGETEMPSTYKQYFGFADGYKALPFDIDGANKVLDDAGYAKGSDGIREDKSGKPMMFRLMGRNTEPAHAQMADFMTSWFKDIGIGLDTSMVTPDKVNEDSTLGKYDLYFTGWSLGPDPDNQLSMNTCASRPNADGSGSTSENNWCSAELDALFKAQHAELDADKRADLVKQAFSVIYEGYVSNPIWYVKPLEAYRSDHFVGFTRQPEKDGVILNQNGYWGLYGAKPASASSSTADDGGLPGWVVPLGAIVVIAAAAGAILASRRRSTGEDRE